MTSIAFTREYLCKPIASESSLFPVEMTEPCKDEDYRIVLDPYAGDFDENVNYYIGWDQRLAPIRKADYTCVRYCYG